MIVTTNKLKRTLFIYICITSAIIEFTLMYLIGRTGEQLASIIINWATTLLIILVYFRSVNIGDSYNYKDYIIPFSFLAQRAYVSFINVWVKYNLMAFDGEYAFRIVNYSYLLSSLVFVITMFAYYWSLGAASLIPKIALPDAAIQKEVIQKKQEINDSMLSKVILSLRERAISSERMTNISLIIMILLVVVGGSASMGTLALNEMQKVRELEITRNKLIKTNEGLKEVVKNINPHQDGSREKTQKVDNQLNDSCIKQISNLNQYIKQNFGDEQSYKNSLEKMEQEQKIRWEDIALRATIAALTLFLVQIFFHIYKFNQQQSSHLYTKAEIIEMYEDKDANQSELRKGILSKLESDPKFGKNPTTPIDQLINLLSKLKETQK